MRVLGKHFIFRKCTTTAYSRLKADSIYCWLSFVSSQDSRKPHHGTKILEVEVSNIELLLL